MGTGRGRAAERVLALALLTRRTTFALAALAFVLTAALAAFDQHYGVPRAAATCLVDCEGAPATGASPASGPATDRDR